MSGKNLLFAILMFSFQVTALAQGEEPTNEVFEVKCVERVLIHCQLNCPSSLQNRAADICADKGFVGANLVRQSQCFRPNPNASVSMTSTFKCFR